MEVAHFVPNTIESRISEKQLIPKKIFQTWKTRKLPPRMYSAVQKIIKLNPDYDYYLFDDEDCKQYLQKHYGLEYLEAFDELIPGAFKADFWRYAVILKEGGVYIDIDFDCIKPLREVIHEDDSLILVKDRGLGCCTAIYQAFFAAVANHEAIKETLDLCLSNIQRRYIGKGPLDITGPSMMGKAFNKYTFSKICDVSLNTGTFSFKGQTYRILIFDFENNLILDKNNEILFKTKFEEYNQLRGDDYGALYRDRQIFRSVPMNNSLNFNYYVFFIFLVLLLLFLMIYTRRKYRY